MINQQATAGIIIASSILTSRALAPVEVALAQWRGFIAARQSWRRLNGLLAAIPAEPPRMELPTPKATLTLEAVGINPPGTNRIVVQGVAFQLKAGQGLGAEVAQATTSEQRLFELRRSAREGQKAQLLEQIDQLRQQILGNDEQVAAKTTEIDWNQQELGGIRGLWKQNLVPFNRVTTLERDAARLHGERGALTASIAQTKGRIAEIQLKILQIDEDLRTEVGKELARSAASAPS